MQLLLVVDMGNSCITYGRQSGQKRAKVETGKRLNSRQQPPSMIISLPSPLVILVIWRSFKMSISVYMYIDTKLCV